MESDESIPGVRRFLGAGVYTSIPATLPPGLRARVAIVRGAGITDALLQLADWCLSVIVVKSDRVRVAAPRARTNITILYATEIVCVDGIDRLECVVVRKVRTGAISVHQASALFLLPRANG